MKNVLIIEDHPLVAEATKSLFLSMSVDKVVICKTADEAAAKLNENHDWFRIFLDIGVPGAHGLSLIRYVHQCGLANRSAIITASDNSEWRGEVEAMGFLGYILKTASVEEFSSAMHQVLDGKHCFNKTKNEVRASHLTRRQIEILGLLHSGLATKEIARKLNLSAGTVDNHIFAILRALRAKDRTHALAIGMNLGYVNTHGHENDISLQ